MARPPRARPRSRARDRLSRRRTTARPRVRAASASSRRRHVERDREVVARRDVEPSVTIGLFIAFLRSARVRASTPIRRAPRLRSRATIRSDGARIGERRGADADRRRAREHHLDRVDPAAHATGADDRHAGERARDVPHRAQRDRLDRRTGQPAAARTQTAARGCCASISSPITELTSVRPDRAARRARHRAIATMSVTLGDSFANVGSGVTDRLDDRRASRSRVASSECANTLPRASTLGHDRLTSTATRRCATAFSGRAAAAYSSARPTPDRRDHARAESLRAREGRVRSTRRHPGPGRPTELSMPPPGASVTRSGGFPDHANAATDFTVTAPSPRGSHRFATSAPCPNVPGRGDHRIREADPAPRSTAEIDGPTPALTGPEPGHVGSGSQLRASAGRRGGTPAANAPRARGATPRRSRPRRRARRRRS